MTHRPLPDQFPELLRQMSKLTELVDPLKAILAAEKKPDLTERIERFLTQVTRVGDQMERAVSAMEVDQDNRAVLKRMEAKMEAQGYELKNMNLQIHAILRLFGTPLDTAEQS